MKAKLSQVRKLYRKIKYKSRNNNTKINLLKTLSQYTTSRYMTAYNNLTKHFTHKHLYMKRRAANQLSRDKYTIDDIKYNVTSQIL